MRQQPTIDQLYSEHADQPAAERQASGWVSPAERRYREQEERQATAADWAAWRSQDR